VPRSFITQQRQQQRQQQQQHHHQYRTMGNSASTTRTSTIAASPAISGAAGITTDDQTNAAARRAKGEFVRGVSSARNWITKEEAPRNDTDTTTTTKAIHYPPASGRYHMYVAYNCPWCHRVLLARALLGLEDVITVDVLYPNRSSDDEPLGPNLWKFCVEGQVGQNGKHTTFPECTVDTVLGKSYAKEIYELAGITDQKSVPILWDKHTNTVVSNESAEIVRMLGVSMKEFGNASSQTPTPLVLNGGGKAIFVDLYPPNDYKAVQNRIDELNDWIYKDIANGSYKAGFSSNQQVYETAYQTYFAALEKVNALLAESTFLTSDTTVTEADLRLFPTLFRHDPIYYSRFKLNEKYLWEYPHLWRWMGDMMALPGMEAVSNAGYLAHCKQGYFGRTGNGTIPVGPKGYPKCYTIRDYRGPLKTTTTTTINGDGGGGDEEEQGGEGKNKKRKKTTV
jgi:putative glutathione S-transferase